MSFIDALTLAGAFTVPLASVSALFYGMMSHRLSAALKPLDENMKRIEGKVDGLASDHNALARELSEVKGYLRGTQPEAGAPRGDERG